MPCGAELVCSRKPAGDHGHWRRATEADRVREDCDNGEVRCIWTTQDTVCGDERTHLVSLDGGNFLVLRNAVSNLLQPCLEGTLGDGLGHLGDLHRLSCNEYMSTTNAAS